MTRVRGPPWVNQLDSNSFYNFIENFSNSFMFCLVSMVGKRTKLVIHPETQAQIVAAQEANLKTKKGKRLDRGIC